MNVMSKEVVDALHTVAAAVMERNKEDVIFEVDYDKEEIRVTRGIFPVTNHINCGGDSVSASIKDFVKQFILKVDLG